MEFDAIADETQKEGTENAQAEKSTVTPAVAQAPDKKPRREDRNRKDDKNLEQFTKAVNAGSTPEEKLSIASQKYAQMLDDNKKMQFYIKQSDKRHALILKEREHLQLEFNKTVLLKSKLENLCRELQKQNKSIKDESMHKIREEEERRKETQAKFQTTLAEISTLLQQNNEKNTKLRDDNISMTEKFKTVVQQYQLREDQVDKMSKQMELETQLNAAKMQKASLEHQAEKERLMAEMEHLKLALLEYRTKVNEMQCMETDLRAQLAVYTDKYDEFQSALMKSNQVFGGFKEQMERMSKTIKKLQKESASWKQRWERSQSALLDMCGERQASDANMLAVQRQLTQMHSLCRTLQAERTVLLATLKENNIERPPLPTPAPAPVPEPPAPVHSAASDAKVDAMAVNCAQLRQSLAHLQSQLNVLTTQQTQQVEEPAPQEKPKKSKSKKNKGKKAKEETTEETGNNDGKSEDVASNAAQKVVETNNDAKPTENAKSEADIAKIVTDNTKTETDNAITESDNAATKLDNAKTKSDNAITESGNATTKSDNATTESDNAKTKSDNAITESDNAKTKSDNATTKSDNATTKSDNATTKSDNTTTKSENAITESDNVLIKTDNAAAAPDNEAKSVDLAFEKVDVKVLESLMNAINIANVKLCDLQVGDDDVTIAEVLEDSQTEIKPESQTNDIAGSPKTKQDVLEGPKKESPKANPKKTKGSSKASSKKTEKTPELLAASELVVAATDAVVKATESIKAEGDAADLPELVPISPEANATPVGFQ